MGWEREHHHINLDASEHVISLIERGVVTRKGEPSRWLIQIKIGSPETTVELGSNSVKIKLGGPLTVQSDGTLMAADGTVWDPKAIEREWIDKLNQHHGALRAYGKKHGAPEYKGPAGGRK
jgi:hypothetical protein